MVWTKDYTTEGKSLIAQRNLCLSLPVYQVMYAGRECKGTTQRHQRWIVHRCQRHRRLLQKSELSAKLTPAAEVGQGRRYRHCNSHENAQRPLTRPDQRPLRPPKLLQTKTALFSSGGLKCLWSWCVGCVWMQFFMAVPMTSSAAMADLGSRRYRQFIPFNFLLSLAAPHLHGFLVLVTSDKFIAGVIVTADNLSPVSTINLSPVSTTPAITENPWQELNFLQVLLTPLNSFMPVSLTPVININSQISQQIFAKNSKRPQWRPGGHWFMKKTEIENLMSDSL